MTTTADPNGVVVLLGAALIVLVGLWYLIGWVRDAPTKPDPWDAEVELQLSDPQTQEICPHCSTPQPPTAWFCSHCGRAVGPYNNLMPYVNVFSEGEVLRNGTSGHLRKGLLVPIGYMLITANFIFTGIIAAPNSAVTSILIFAGLISYWMLIWKNFFRQPKAEKPLPPGEPN